MIEIPIPSTVWLLGSALVVLIAVKECRRVENETTEKPKLCKDYSCPYDDHGLCNDFEMNSEDGDALCFKEDDH